MEIQNKALEFEENMALTAFRKGDLIACRESDGYCFNIIELINDVDFKNMTSRLKVKRNIFTLHCKDEEDAVIFQKEHQWKSGNMQFAHILRKERDKGSNGAS